jgi:hypothetical protein
MAQLSGRGFVGGDLFLAVHPSEILWLDSRGRGKSRGVSLSAGVAMTMSDWGVELRNVVFDRTAQSTASHELPSTSATPDARHRDERRGAALSKGALSHTDRCILKLARILLPVATALAPLAVAGQWKNYADDTEGR